MSTNPILGAVFQYGRNVSPIDRAAEIIGSQAALALVCGVSRGAVNQWKDEGRRVPAEYCPAIERATKGQVRCEELRPDIDWAYLRQSPALVAGPAGPEEVG
jgi:DNA-binding transcriptional regulator YdaS (Cro superfamily)